MGWPLSEKPAPGSKEKYLNPNEQVVPSTGPLAVSSVVSRE
jgi:hypothetical protein